MAVAALGKARMRVTAEILAGRREQQLELPSNATGVDLLKALRLALDAHILVRGEVPIPADEALREGEKIRVIGVVSGGAT